jgi:PAS domain S-box-containing protein
MGRKPTYEELEEKVKILEKKSIEHKRAEEALRESKERYALATRAAMVGVWDWNVQTGKFYLDPNVKAILGYGDEEIPNDLDVWATYVHPDDKQAVMEAFQAHLEGKTPEFVYEHRMLHKEGSVRWILARGTAMRDAQGNAVRVVGADADITLRKRAEEALRRRLDYENMVTYISTQAISIDDIAKFQDDCLEIMGRTLDVSRIYIFEHCHETDTMDNTFEWVASGITPQKDNLQGIPSRVIPWWMDTMKNDKIINYKDIEGIPGEKEKKILRPQGIESILVVPLFVQGEYHGFIGFDECRNKRAWLVEDVELLRTISQIITGTLERKQAEESLQKSEDQYRLLADNVIDIISHHSLDGTVLYVSPSVSALLGYEPRELIGTNGFNPLIPPDDLPKIQSKIIRLLKKEHSSDQLEHRMIKKNGNYVWVETTSRLRQNTNNDQSVEIISVTREITERKQANLALQEKEQKLERQSQHLEEVNTALKVLLEHREEEKKKSEENILSNVQKLVFPYIEKLENSRLDDKNKTYVDIIRSNLKELISPFGNTLSSKYSILTPTEIQVADLIKHGRTSKEIASLLNVSPKAISFHRGNIRKKLGLVNKKRNLRSHLQSLAT